jgi:hypothetical protein
MPSIASHAPKAAGRVAQRAKEMHKPEFKVKRMKPAHEAKEAQAIDACETCRMSAV